MHFFRSSPKRTKLLENKIKEFSSNQNNKRIKKMCETRWCERHEAVFLFKETLEPILASLEEIKEWPGELSQKATSLLNSISNLNFIITLYVLSKFLGITYTCLLYTSPSPRD